MLHRPSDPAGIVGRQVERAALAERLAPGRLVTLVGPGGVGKTRLALDALAQAGEAGAFVALEAAESVAGVIAAVASALAVPGLAGEVPAAQAERVARALAARGPFLLVLDNLEQVLAAAPQLAAWRAAAPALTVLATSRAPLALRDETVLDLGPLSLPDARALFAARVAAAGGRLGEDAAAVDALLARLDRLPLALELAAARTRLLSPAGLLARLEAGQTGLGRGAWRDRPARQADLAASVGWSWRLLTADQQADLTACAVFRGAFDADAAAAVLAERQLDGLADLLDHSLVQRLADERFALFGMVRAYALAHGPAPVLAAAADGHRAWYLAQARTHAAQAHGPQAVAAGAWLVAEQPNVVAAVDAALAAQAAEDAICGLRALRPLVYTGTVAPAYSALLDRACALPDPRTQGWARCLRGELARLQGRLTDAAADLDRAIATPGDARLAATAHAERGIVAHELGDLTQAAHHHEAARAGFEALGDGRGVGRAVGSVAVTQHARGQAGDARETYEQALDLLAAEGDRRSWAIFTCNLGDLHLDAGRPGEARACYEDAREALLALGDRRIAAAVTGNLGGVLLAEDAVDRAIACRQEAVETLEAIGDDRLAAVFRGYLGLARHAGGDLTAAVADYAQAERVLARLGDRRHAGLFAAHRAAALAAQGDAEGAEQALAAADAALAVLDEPAARAVPAIARGHLHLARGDRAAAEACLGVGDDEGEDQQMARRLLRVALNAGEAQAAPLRLVVARDGSAFALSDGPTADLGRRHVLRRLLSALIEIRLRSPGAGLDLDDLLAAGWPGEQMSQASGANRIYVAIATLRREGLEQILIKRPLGYLLDPAVEVVVGEPAAES
ncbi:MAG: hypothetical protein H6702_10805 [Myxococcales bacterium]|nr:hypothetical protein [Myxococcales bacterium]